MTKSKTDMTDEPARDPLARLLQAHPQGNRVKESCGDKAREEIVIPCRDLSAEAE